MKLSFCSNGIISTGLIRPFADSRVISGASSFKRGKIHGFSDASCRRFREVLCHLRGEGTPFAFTFTFPFDLSPREYVRFFERFRHRLVYAGFGMIWRVELTKHKRPHLHCIFYLPGVREAFEIQELWWKVVNAFAFEGGCFYSAVFQELDNVKWFKYLCAHTAKQKIAQLGWRGRQWGVVNKDLFYDVFNDVELDRPAWFRLVRVLRRVSRCRSRSRGLFGESTWFVAPDTVLQLAKWASSL